MKTKTQVVVIGGGVIGCSVLYHLTKFGWRDVMLLERKVLTAGSTWHAAAGFHTLNGDMNMARLQSYTIELYKEIQQVGDQDVASTFLAASASLPLQNAGSSCAPSTPAISSWESSLS